MLISNFRVGAPEGEFQISMDCTYRPNDVVPIVGRISGFNSVFVSSLSSPVGCALAGLVLMVLVAYLVGEHRASKIGEHE